MGGVTGETARRRAGRLGDSPLGPGGSHLTWSFVDVPVAVSIQTPTAKESPLGTSCPRERGWGETPPGEGRRVPRSLKFGSVEKGGPCGAAVPPGGFQEGRVSRTRGLSLWQVRGRCSPTTSPADLGLAGGLKKQGPGPHELYFLAPWVPPEPKFHQRWGVTPERGWGRFTPPQGFPRLPPPQPGSRQEPQKAGNAFPGRCGDGALEAPQPRQETTGREHPPTSRDAASRHPETPRREAPTPRAG